MTASDEHLEPMRIVVVIPFFQREPGILQRALHSVYRQEIGDNVLMRVIVVDDGSPIRARDELAAMTFAAHMDVQLIEQQNGGPGSARNRALDELGSNDQEFVAFLDSDDIWRPNHIRDARAALSDCADFYFCDHTRFDLKASWFETLDGTKNWKSSPRDHLSPAGQGVEAYCLERKEAFDALLREYLSQTSTVVYRWYKHREIRFDIQQRNAGEDHLFWLELVRQGNGTVISFEENVHCGEGVNIYYSAMAWTDSKVVDRFAYLLLFTNKVTKSFELERKQKDFLSNQTTRYARAHGFLFVRSLLRRHLPDLTTTTRLFMRDPACVLLIPYYFLSVLPNRKTESLTW